ncbi:putative paraoxonase [Xylaria sp. CBS 124048]|nr:putative paraoxonase [Xylaria sp. CBS 124048]
MVFKATIAVIAVALLMPFLYERAQTLALFWRNAPHRLVKVDTFASHEVKFADRIRSCEDVLLIETTGIALLACDPGREVYNTVMGIFLPGPVDNGRLYTYDYKNGNLSDDEALKELTFVDFEAQSQLHTLGMAFNETTSILYVANHRQDAPSIEMFKVNFNEHTATHMASIQHPLLHGPNSIALVNEHELLVTNDHHFLFRENPLMSMLETYLAFPGGTVVHVDMSPIVKDAVLHANVVAHVPFANGIELLNKTTVAIASSSGAKIHLYSIQRPNKQKTGRLTLERVSAFRVPFSPDNLSVSQDGALMISGHPHFPSLAEFARTRHICNEPEEYRKADKAMQETCRTLVAPSVVARWTEKEGLQMLYTGTDYSSSATAARDARRKMGIVAGLYAKGIFVWRE